MTGRDGLFIAFEGGDGAGKSTQVRLLAQALRARGRVVTVTRQPGGTDLGAAIRDLVLHGDHVSPRAEALLFAADKAHHVDQLVRPALDAGKVVLTDRYTDSSVAYQGAGRDLGAAEVHDLQMWAVDALVPALTVVVDITAAEGRRERPGRDRPTGPRRSGEQPGVGHRLGGDDRVPQGRDRALLADDVAPDAHRAISPIASSRPRTASCTRSGGSVPSTTR
ncbi:MAG TPA: dTMP kinase [Ornithinibacter sp.]|nr:dTMP kinase [Ornithinibacter sp.]